MSIRRMPPACAIFLTFKASWGFDLKRMRRRATLKDRLVASHTAATHSAKGKDDLVVNYGPSVWTGIRTTHL